MNPPIIVRPDDGDTMIFRSLEDAEAYLEPAEVLEKSYAAYDSEGRLLEVTAPGAKKSRFLGLTSYSGSKITIKSTEAFPTHASQLVEILRDNLERRGVGPKWLQEASLNELVNAAVEKIGFD